MTEGRIPWPSRWLTDKSGNFATVIVIGLLVVGAAGLAVRSCAGPREAAEAQAGTTAATGQAALTQDTQRVVVDVVQHGAAIDAQTRENRDAIMATQGASENIPAGVAAAGRRALCLRPTYRHQPACDVVRGANPG